MAKHLKDEGNIFYKNKDYEQAIKKYARVKLFTKPFLPSENSEQMLSMVAKSQDKLSNEETQEVVELQASTSLNMAICFFLLKNYEKSIQKATESIALKKTIKGYYRRGKAYAALSQYENAADDMKLAVKMDTSDPNDIQ